jgi:hypothetical protein
MTYVHDIKDHPPTVITVGKDGSEVGIVRPFETFINPAYYQQPRPRLASHSRSTGSTRESEGDYDANHPPSHVKLTNVLSSTHHLNGIRTHNLSSDMHRL